MLLGSHLLPVYSADQMRNALSVFVFAFSEHFFHALHYIKQKFACLAMVGLVQLCTMLM